MTTAVILPGASPFDYSLHWIKKPLTKSIQIFHRILTLIMFSYPRFNMRSNSWPTLESFVLHSVCLLLYCICWFKFSRRILSNVSYLSSWSFCIYRVHYVAASCHHSVQGSRRVDSRLLSVLAILETAQTRFRIRRKKKDGSFKSRVIECCDKRVMLFSVTLKFLYCIFSNNRLGRFYTLAGWSRSRAWNAIGVGDQGLRISIQLLQARREEVLAEPLPGHRWLLSIALRIHTRHTQNHIDEVCHCEDR